MSRLARVYRVVAHYGDRTVARDFLTKRARDRWAEVFRTGREGEVIADLYDDVLVGYVEKADRVETFDSAPVEWQGADTDPTAC